MVIHFEVVLQTVQPLFGLVLDPLSVRSFWWVCRDMARKILTLGSDVFSCLSQSAFIYTGLPYQLPKLFYVEVQYGPTLMGPVLLQEETGVPGENLRSSVRSNWTTLLSHVTKVILIRLLHGAGIEP